MENVNKNKDIHTEQEKIQLKRSFFFFHTTINKTDVMQSCQWKANFGIKQALEKYFLKRK